MKITLKLSPDDIKIAIDNFLRDSEYTRISEVLLVEQKQKQNEEYNEWWMEIEVKVERLDQEK